MDGVNNDLGLRPQLELDLTEHLGPVRQGDKLRMSEAGWATETRTNRARHAYLVSFRNMAFND